MPTYSFRLISQVAQLVKNPPANPWVDPWVRRFSWRRKRQPTPVFLPGKFHGQRSLAGYSPCGHRHNWAHTRTQFVIKRLVFVRKLVSVSEHNHCAYLMNLIQTQQKNMLLKGYLAGKELFLLSWALRTVVPAFSHRCKLQETVCMGWRGHSWSEDGPVRNSSSSWRLLIVFWVILEFQSVSCAQHH